MLNNKFDTLKVILTKYKDKVDINYSTPKKVTALHLLFNNKDIKGITLSGMFRYNLFTHENVSIPIEGKKMFLNLENLDFNVKRSNKLYSPLQIAIMSRNYELGSILIDRCDQLDLSYISENKKESVFDGIFSNAISKFAEKLLHNGYTMSISNFDYDLIHIDFKFGMIKSQNNNDFKYFKKTFFSFFFRELGEIDIKNKIINDNIAFFACFIARYMDLDSFFMFMDIYDVDINVVDPINEVTPLFSSLLNISPYTNDIINKYQDMIDFDYANSKNVTLAHIICNYYNMNYFSNDAGTIFLKISNINAQVEGSLLSPLHLAIIKPYSHLSSLLKCPNIDVNIKDSNGNTPLHLACIHINSINLKFFELLLNHPNIDLMPINNNVFFSFFTNLSEKNANSITLFS